MKKVKVRKTLEEYKQEVKDLVGDEYTFLSRNIQNIENILPFGTKNVILLQE